MSTNNRLVWSNNNQVLNGTLDGKPFYVKGRSGWQGVWEKTKYRWTDPAGDQAKLERGHYSLHSFSSRGFIELQQTPCDVPWAFQSSAGIYPRMYWSKASFKLDLEDPKTGATSTSMGRDVLLMVELDYTKLQAAINKAGQNKVELFVV